MEMISWTDRARNEEALHKVKEKINILHKIKKVKAHWIGHSICRTCPLRHTVEGKIEG
jgi:hypothetical protein